MTPPHQRTYRVGPSSQEEGDMSMTPIRIEKTEPTRGTAVRRTLAGTMAALALVALSA